MFLGAIADDVTGGTDLASVLRRAGLRVVQTLGLPPAILPPADAVVVSLKTRTAPVAEATAAAAAAAALLLDAAAAQLYFKYCSTFDSTDEGNIGPVIETLLDRLAVPFTVACPAYPALDRTVYQGHLFVGDRLLSDSPMRHHPLTPMTDSNLVGVLQRQCRGSVGLVPLADVEAGVAATEARFAALVAAGYRVAIADAILDRHLQTLAAACAPLRLVTGGAALAGGLALTNTNNVAREGASRPAPHVTAPVAVLSGSCSAATLAQVQRLAGEVPARALDPVRLAEDARELPRLIDWASDQARRGLSFLLYSTARSDTVEAAQARLGRVQAAALLEGAFRQLATALGASGVRTFVVAGGETSGAVLQGLGIRLLGFGDEIDPGVPWSYSLDPEGFMLALKSGNFGSPDFFAKAIGTAV
jgi:uncharacterized protein YgbK (DUF1537 family)